MARVGRAVSYTHLDVYKRQGDQSRQKCRGGHRRASSFTRAAAVDGRHQFHDGGGGNARGAGVAGDHVREAAGGVSSGVRRTQDHRRDTETQRRTKSKPESAEGAEGAEGWAVAVGCRR